MCLPFVGHTEEGTASPRPAQNAWVFNRLLRRPHPDNLKAHPLAPYTTFNPLLGAGGGVYYQHYLNPDAGYTILASHSTENQADYFVRYVDLALAQQRYLLAGEAGYRNDRTARFFGLRAEILVVDDEASARITLALLLKQRGHRVTQAEGVRAVGRAVTDALFDIVITDLRVPDGDGLGVLRMTKTNCPDAEVILLTAYAGWESAKEAMRLGAFDYFEKGKDPDELLQRIDKALEKKRRRCSRCWTW